MSLQNFFYALLHLQSSINNVVHIASYFFLIRYWQVYLHVYGVIGHVL